VIVDNEFRGLFYGFYSYEARDVAIVDNRYVDNIRYGIDPHDRSTRLVIARNTASGTRERHGIIGSREVSHSWIVDNEARDNAGSGIMLDRQCANNVIRGNQVYRNGQGIAIYESPHNRLQDNLIAFNAKSGIRVRNSVDVAAIENRLLGNGDYAFELSARRLDDHEQRAKRGDHYEAAVEVEIQGARVAGNRGLVKAAQLDGLKLSGVQVDQQAAEAAAELGVTGASIDNTKNLSVCTDLKPFARDVLRALDPGRPLVHIRAAK
jgi:poly(beta-D-mannuronate) C5 epimerase